jgi:hypothetical protein
MSNQYTCNCAVPALRQPPTVVKIRSTLALMLLAFRLVIYALGGFLSMSCATNIGGNGKYTLIGFGVGPIFAVVVLLWQNDSIRSLFRSESLKFLLLSTLIWSLVDWLLHSAFGDKYFELVILVGSILLPCAHAWVFRSSWSRACLAIPLSFAAFECSRLIPDSSPHWVEQWVNAASLWQGGYLLAMFGPPIRPAKTLSSLL